MYVIAMHSLAILCHMYSPDGSVVSRERRSICSREANVTIFSMSSTKTLESGLRYMHFSLL